MVFSYLYDLNTIKALNSWFDILGNVLLASLCVR